MQKASHFQLEIPICGVCLTPSILLHSRFVIDTCGLTLSANICQLLEAIGVISKKDSEKSAACGGNYQDEVTIQAHNDDSEACRDNDDCEENVLEAISKVCLTGWLLLSLTPLC
jgi:hypothetical protein